MFAYFWQRVTGSIVTVNYALRILRGVLQDAVDLGCLNENVAARVKRLRAPDGDGKDAMHFLTPAEIGRLLNAADEPWRSLYEVAVYTGLRRGELLGLRWRDVDLEAAVLHVRRSLGRIKDGDAYVVREAPVKTKASRRMVDLSPSIVQTFLAIPAGDDPEQDYVFRSRIGGWIDPDNVDRALKRHLTLARLPEDIRLHDLRHTFASLLIAVNAHPKYIQAQMGHTSITVTMDRYGHLMRIGFERVGARLDALVQGTSKAQTAKTEA